jgi:hypothetical protein
MAAVGGQNTNNSSVWRSGQQARAGASSHNTGFLHVRGQMRLGANAPAKPIAQRWTLTWMSLLTVLGAIFWDASGSE